MNESPEDDFEEIERVIKKLPACEKFVNIFRNTSFDKMPPAKELAGLVSENSHLEFKDMEKLSAELGYVLQYPSGVLKEGAISLSSLDLFGRIILPGRNLSVEENARIFAHELGHIFVYLFRYAKHISPFSGPVGLNNRRPDEEEYVWSFADALTRRTYSP